MGSAAAPRTAQPTRAPDSRRQFSPSGPSPPPDQIAFGSPFTVHHPLSTIHYPPSVLYHKISPGKKCYSLDLKDCANRCQKPPFRTQKGGFRAHRRRCPLSKWRYSPNSAASRGTVWHHLAPSGTFSSQKASHASRPNSSKPCFNQHYHFDHRPPGQWHPGATPAREQSREHGTADGTRHLQLLKTENRKLKTKPRAGAREESRRAGDSGTLRASHPSFGSSRPFRSDFRTPKMAGTMGLRYTRNPCGKAEAPRIGHGKR